MRSRKRTLGKKSVLELGNSFIFRCEGQHVETTSDSHHSMEFIAHAENYSHEAFTTESCLCVDCPPSCQFCHGFSSTLRHGKENSTTQFLGDNSSQLSTGHNSTISVWSFWRSARLFDHQEHLHWRQRSHLREKLSGLTSVWGYSFWSIN